MPGSGFSHNDFKDLQDSILRELAILSGLSKLDYASSSSLFHRFSAGVPHQLSVKASLLPSTQSRGRRQGTFLLCSTFARQQLTMDNVIKITTGGSRAVTTCPEPEVFPSLITRIYGVAPKQFEHSRSRS
jgi:hypothetical protein